MADDFLGDRRKALEDSFFSQQSDKLIHELRERRQREQRVQALSSASGISNQEVLEALANVGIESSTLAALALVPLVAVAWADGSIKTGERQAILRAAHEAGIEEGHPSHALLDGWLQNRPGPEVLNAWREYIAGLREHLDPVATEALHHDILGRAREVAEAAGGFLGAGPKVSRAEEDVLAELARAFA